MVHSVTARMHLPEEAAPRLTQPAQLVAAHPPRRRALPCLPLAITPRAKHLRRPTDRTLEPTLSNRDNDIAVVHMA